MLKPRWMVVVAMILAAALSRLLPHPPNLTSVAAVALFGGACFADRRLAVVVPLAALLLGDLVLGFYHHMEVTYLSFALIAGLGHWLRHNRSVPRIACAAVAGSVLFFVTSNAGVWLFDGMYPLTYQGLVACYVAAIPFFWNTMMGDLLYAGLLFGGLALLERRFSALRDPGMPAAQFA